ncbi:MAG: hypothetical protein FJ087_06130 [Deltaproteobacteria bacterium]|nr:hypothetical protein [Deltaproteobacteria bacterium]
MRGSLLVTAFLALALCGACAREIGDDCSTNTDCGENRICDTSQPGGYCTVTPCRDDSECPGESICVEFSVDATYCMRACSDLKPCRVEYECVRDFKDFAPFCDQALPSASLLP